MRGARRSGAGKTIYSGARTLAQEKQVRDALVETIALDIIYEAAQEATDETGAEVAAEVMAETRQPGASLEAISSQGTKEHNPVAETATPSSEQAPHHHTPCTRSTGKASPA